MTEKVVVNGQSSTVREEISDKILTELKDLGWFDLLLPRTSHTLASESAETAENKQGFRIMQWNILAQGLSLCGKFVLCPKEVLSFDRRLRYVILELLRYNADIICLEEVDMFDHLHKYLKQVGYLGTFVPKENSPCLLFHDNMGPDGCVIFYNTNRLRCLSSTNFQLGNGVSQVALVQLMQSIENPNIKFFVTVTHFKAKVPFSEVRKKQGDVLISKLNEVCRKDSSLSHVPIFVCCDMNADPDEAVVSTFKSSDFKFRSTYSLLDKSGNEPEFTTWKFRGESNEDVSESRHTIDYMWYQKSACVKPLSLISIPPKEVIGDKALPCPAFPSDHMSLIADFSIGSEC